MLRSRALPLALLALLAAPAAADVRLKVDRYEAATLPEVKLWVTLLDGEDPIRPDRIELLSVFANGDLLEDVDAETAAEHDEPMAVAAVLDARLPQQWKATREAIAAAFDDLPGGSLGAVRVFNFGIKAVPEDADAPWFDEPDKLAPTLRDIEAGGGESFLYTAMREALQQFPLRPGLEADKDDGKLPPPPKDGEDPFPTDRVLYVVADGQMKVRPDERPTQRLQELVYLARRRGVRIMAIGVADTERAKNLWVLETLARKTGGTYRRAPLVNRTGPTVAEAAEELRMRQVITADVPELRRGDPVSFSVRAKLKTGETRTTRDYTDRAENVLSLWDRAVDAASNKWEGLPVWARVLITVVAAVLVVAIVLLIVLLRLRKAAKARDKERAAREAELALRKPCPVCGNMMMPNWKDCLFCAQARAAQRPMRFRLVGRSGSYAGQALRFDKGLVIFGAAPGCDIHLPEHGVSREHCGLRDRGEQEFLLSDFNTDGGTWVNGERITQARLNEGDVVRVGASEFVFGIES